MSTVWIRDRVMWSFHVDLLRQVWNTFGMGHISKYFLQDLVSSLALLLILSVRNNQLIKGLAGEACHRHVAHPGGRRDISTSSYIVHIEGTPSLTPLTATFCQFTSPSSLFINRLKR